jgi:6-phosphogluconolactonase
MPYYMYIALQDDDKIAIFTMDADTGRLTPKADVSVTGSPSLLAISPDRQVLYAGQRAVPGISSCRIDHATGGLTKQGAVTLEGAPAFLATDRTGRYVLSASYQGGYVAVYPLGADGAVGALPVSSLQTATGAHAILTDPSNRFAFVPHIARFYDNVLEPLRESYGPNAIWQLRFDERTGQLTPNSPLRVEPQERLGPRHFCFHPTQDVVYFSNEQGCSVTAYRLDTATGTLSPLQTISTLPEGCTERNTCSQIQLSPSGKFLYVPNRGHNSIAGFSVDATTGRLTAIGQVPTEAVPSAFSLDPQGTFVFAAGSASGRLASYRINNETGELTPLETYAVGKRPMWVLITRLGDA